MVRIPTTSTSTRKNVAKPSTINMPPKAGPACEFAYTAPPMAATRVAMLKWPKACEERRWRIGSSTISSVPITVRIVSGRKRIRSAALNP